MNRARLALRRGRPDCADIGRAVLTRLALAIGIGAALTLAACDMRSEQSERPGGGMVVLTVTGAINMPNRGGFDPGRDLYFSWLGADFRTARGFSRGDLNALPQHRLHTQSDALLPGTYEGPRLEDVLDLTGVSGRARTLTAFALDGYSAEIPLAEVRRSNAILALRRDGQTLALGGTGPMMIVFPDRAQASPDWYVWGLVLLRVDE